MSTAEEAQAIRTALKPLGLTSRDVSVKSNVYSMGSSIHISLKSEKALPYRKQIEKVANQYEKIDRDSITGEILCGGNQFIQVGISYELEKMLREKHADEINAAIKKAVDSPNSMVELWGIKFFYHGENQNFYCMNNGPSYRNSQDLGWFLLRQRYN